MDQEFLSLSRFFVEVVLPNLQFYFMMCWWSLLVPSFFFGGGGGFHFLLAMFHLRFTASYYPFTIVEHLLYLVDNPHLCEKYYNRQLVPLYQMIHEISFQFINIYSISAVKTGLQSYCDTSYFRGDVHQMWILIISKDLLESMSCSTWNSIINI